MNLHRVLACAGEMLRFVLMFLWAIFCLTAKPVVVKSNETVPFHN